jgi:ketosteroid isomerase-like protein
MVDNGEVPRQGDAVEHNKAVVRRVVHEFVCKGDASVLAEHCTPDYRFYPIVYTGSEDRDTHAVDNSQSLNRVFPDLKAEILTQVGEGDRVATHHVLTGTHRAEMITPLGVIAPTGKRVTWRTIAFHRFRDGAIAEGW